MRMGEIYKGGITEIIQEELDQIWQQKIAEADDEWKEVCAARKMKEYLNDATGLATFSFVLRRYIQLHAAEILGEENGKQLWETCPDLSHGKNTPWPEAGIELVAKQLAQIAREQGYKGLPKTIWKRYLSEGEGAQVPKRNMIFRISFLLHMDVLAVMDLFLAAGQEGYDLRNPEDLIFWFCQSRPSSAVGAREFYTLDEAENLVQKYFDAAHEAQAKEKAQQAEEKKAGRKQSREQEETGKKQAEQQEEDKEQSAQQERTDKKQGLQQEADKEQSAEQEDEIVRTAAILDVAQRLVNSDLPRAEAEEELLGYMLCHWKEFGGYSVSRRENLDRLLEYLGVFYRVHPVRKSNRERGKKKTGVKEESMEMSLARTIFAEEDDMELPSSREIVYESIERDKDGNLPLRSLLMGMFTEHGWGEDHIKAEEEGGENTEAEEAAETEGNVETEETVKIEEDTGAGENAEVKDPFAQTMDKLLNGCYGRLYDARRGKKPLCRRDVLLLTFFLASAVIVREISYEEYTSADPAKNWYAEEYRQLKQMFEKGTELDNCVKDYISINFADGWNAEEEEMADAIWDALNNMLDCFGLHSLYLPNCFDRFLYMTLLREGAHPEQSVNILENI